MESIPLDLFSNTIDLWHLTFKYGYEWSKIYLSVMRLISTKRAMNSENVSYQMTSASFSLAAIIWKLTVLYNIRWQQVIILPKKLWEFTDIKEKESVESYLQRFFIFSIYDCLNSKRTWHLKIYFTIKSTSF